MTRRRAGHPLAGRLQLGEVQPAKAIQERFGHSSITVTLDRYGHLFPSLDETLADNFDRSFGKTLARPARPETAS